MMGTILLGRETASATDPYLSAPLRLKRVDFYVQVSKSGYRGFADPWLLLGLF